ncbi:NAD(P)/FAD-dependent oxidoreductase [Desulfosporosinus sp. BICA1-9]|uniref:NAD(P)/FAD-dependent oxidoreductase n=1 Tax=Desulfosporosinus sp. BICA1-9 TaxID=1531958 RepID=UPI00054C4470|nr:NAD(P)/FAD-dependent oxidoreductase [Desulfosporosinus sp. BICA1-9]KJS50523.1 MAG: FAD-dependent oxidoreductase [Peptococcaceae bacterium BRH_c23]KJS81728.1 MAG: FAD-dependent oxidoreductase [Desulfosporosinus sp. BICA1-9]HBW36126.1 NAD(P)/FAD-dependent oxidoreductase [Desulfosporosinus sp.]
MNEYQVIVVGGGAAGMMAAGQAAIGSAKVLLVEKKERLGRKIAITGKGRCNITNEENVSDFISHYPGNGRFLHGILRGFDNVALRDFFARYGVETKVERGGRVFPISDDAEKIVDALAAFLTETGVEVRSGITVEEILVENGHVAGVRGHGQKKFLAPVVIVCTGGSSYPATGSSGDGFRFARKLGHKVITPRPALVPLKTAEDWVKELQGLSLKNVEGSLWIDGKKQITEFGEMLFTHFGVSGPIILTMSRRAGDALCNGEQVELRVNFKPALTQEQLDARVQRDFQKYSNKQFKNALDDLLPQSLIPVMIRLSGINPEGVVHQISREQRKRLLRLLQELPMTITETLSIETAIVTAGGVDVKEINPKTMASKCLEGLYWAGEVVDVDGITGGYNLQAAFAMGYRAGCAAREVALSVV